MRANGESIADVLTLLLWEAGTLGFLGAVCGVLTAYAFNATFLANGVVMPPAPGLTRQYAVKIELQPLMALVAIVLGITAALVSTLAAGSKVARTPIAEALRTS